MNTGRYRKNGLRSTVWEIGKYAKGIIWKKKVYHPALNISAGLPDGTIDEHLRKSYNKIIG